MHPKYSRQVQVWFPDDKKIICNQGPNVLWHADDLKYSLVCKKLKTPEINEAPSRRARKDCVSGETAAELDVTKRFPIFRDLAQVAWNSVKDNQFSRTRGVVNYSSPQRELFVWPKDARLVLRLSHKKPDVN